MWRSAEIGKVAEMGSNFWCAWSPDFIPRAKLSKNLTLIMITRSSQTSPNASWYPANASELVFPPVSNICARIHASNSKTYLHKRLDTLSRPSTANSEGIELLYNYPALKPQASSYIHKIDPDSEVVV